MMIKNLLVKNRLSVIIFSIIFLSGFKNSYSANLTSVGAGGPFEAAGTWGGFIPSTGDNITITTGATVTVTANSDILGWITVNSGGKLIINNSATASLSFEGNITINGEVTNNGRMDMVLPANFVMGPNAIYTHNPRANTASDESMFELGTENISPTSTLIIQKWSSAALPLCDATRINADIGHLITSVGGTPWEQKGKFAPDRIKGNLTVLNGILRMDDGSGANPMVLTLNNVLIKGSSAIIFQEGNNKNFTLNTLNFTDSSSLTSQATVLMNTSIGVLNWTVTGTFRTIHDFIAVNDSTFPLRSALPATVNISGDMLISGAGNKFDFIKQTNIALNVTVGGTTSISGTPGWVRFIDCGTGNLNFTTNFLTISGGLKNTFLGGNEFLDASLNPLFPLPTGYVNVKVLTDFTMSGINNTTILNSIFDVNKARLEVLRDYISSSTTADLKVAKSIGPVTVAVTRNLTLNGGNFDVQNYASSNAVDSISCDNFTFNSAAPSNYFRGNCGAGNTVFTAAGNFVLTTSGVGVASGFSGNYLNNGNLEFYVGSDFTQNGGAFYGINEGNGNLNFTVVGTLNQTAGNFKATHNLSSIAAGTNSISLGALNFQGGNFIQYNASNGNVVLNVVNDFIVNYTSVADLVSIIPYFNPSSSNSSTFTATIGGSMVFGGANGTFYSSVSQGNEAISITGNLSFNNGTNSFNLYPSAVINSFHNVTLTVGGNINCTNGNNYLSAGRGDILVNVNGNMNFSGGSLSLKGNSPTNPAIMNIMGGFTQTNGTFYFHNNTTLTSIETTVTVNSDDDATGNFVQSGGTINMDNNISSGTLKTLSIKSPNYTIGPAGTIMRIGSGTINARGTILFSKTGTMIFSRTTGHSVLHTTQEIVTGTTLDVTVGDLQLSSYVPEFVGHNLNMLNIQSNAVLTLRNSSQVFSNGIAPKCYVNVSSNARLRLQHPSGLYNASAIAALNVTGNLLYYLMPTSTIEYFGNTNQIITGIGAGTAVGGGQKYGNLEINLTGPISNYAYPTSIGTVAVRTQLKLTRGELRLADPANVGATLAIETTAPTGIAFTPNRSYIKSETPDGTGILKWTIGLNTLAHIIPFAMDTTVAGQIPVSFTNNAAVSASEVSFCTYRTSAANLPLPPLVGHVNSIATGNDNSTQCADRFWKISSSGTSTNFNVSLVATASEIATVAPAASQFRAQHYNYNGGFWDNPFQGAQTYTAAARNVTANGVTATNDWWVLVNQATPLPVELLSFNATCDGKKNLLKWSTAAELNNDYFEVRKSSDGNYFNEWKQVKGNGTVNTTSTYELADVSVKGAKSYYKLFQVDYDGKRTELKTVYALGCDDATFNVASVYSASGKISSIVSSPVDFHGTITIVDVNGKMVYTNAIEIVSGITSLETPQTLAAGIYYLQITDGENLRSGKKFMITK